MSEQGPLRALLHPTTRRFPQRAARERHLPGFVGVPGAGLWRTIRAQTGNAGAVMVDVLVVEDEPRTRERLASIIAAHPDLRLQAQAGSLDEARAALDLYLPDVVLLDLGLPDGSGLSLLDELRARRAKTEVLVISVLGDESSVLRAIERGAGGYLLKDADDAAVVAAIDQLLAGGAPLSPSIAVHLMRRLQSPPRVSAAEIHDIGLTERERELLKLIAKGLSYDEVSQLMGLKYNTITSYAKELYRKLQVHSRAEAVFEAQQLGLVGSN